MRSRIIIAAALLAGLALPSHAQAVTETASAGNVNAVFGYDFTPDSDLNFGGTYANEQVTITRGGQAAYTRTLCGAGGGGDFCLYPLRRPNEVSFDGRPSLEIHDLEANGEPDVLLHLVTGGNGCCLEDRIFRWDAGASTYQMIERHWPSYVGEQVADLGHDGTLEFVSADGRFWAQFASPGGSAYPLQVFRFRGGTFTDVTRQFPDAIAADARRQWREYRTRSRKSYGGLGQMAAWVADQYLLGHRASALSTLRRERALGHLSHGESSYWVKRFRTHLPRVLKKLGYTDR